MRNTIFSCNVNANYSTKNSKCRYHNSIKFSLLDVFLAEKGPSVKIQLLNIFKDQYIVAKQSTTSVGYDEWPLTNALWMKFHDSYDKYEQE